MWDFNLAQVLGLLLRTLPFLLLRCWYMPASRWRTSSASVAAAGGLVIGRAGGSTPRPAVPSGARWSAWA